MASILDSGLVNIFASIFVFLLVFALAWGALTKLKPFGEKASASYSIISFAIAILMAAAPPARNFVLFVAPWYVAFAIVLFFILFIVGMFGLSADKDFPGIIRDPLVYTWVTIICILIFIAGLAFSFGQQSLEATQPGAGYPGPVANPGDPNQDPYIVAPGGLNPYSVPQPGQPGSTATNNFTTNLINTMIHPKVLGLLITFIIAAIAVYFISRPSHA
jgi:hypothetical protein